jgi:hypothetical protein
MIMLKIILEGSIVVHGEMKASLMVFAKLTSSNAPY